MAVVPEAPVRGGVAVLVVLTVVLLAAIAAGVAAVAGGTGGSMSPAQPDLADPGLPSRPVRPDDVAGVRLQVALRGYRMDQVDDVLERLQAELADRDELLADAVAAGVLPTELLERAGRWLTPQTPQTAATPQTPVTPTTSQTSETPQAPQRADPPLVAGGPTAPGDLADPQPADEQP